MVASSRLIDRFRVVAITALTLGFGLMLGLPNAHAARITSFSPQNEITQIRQVRVAFSEAAVKFGDPKAPIPFDIQCSEAGSGRWADDKHWIYDFVRDLPPGVTCTFTLKAEFKAVSGSGFDGKTAFRFNTGGPAVLSTRPYDGATITEEQMFVVQQNGAATKESLAQHVFCEAENVHERIPAALIAGAPRSALLKEFFPKIDPGQISIFQCQQRLPAGAKVQLVWDKGIQTPSGVPTSVRQEIKFEVRADFTASFSCQRENANAACTPVLPVRVDFSTPVSRKLAENIVLTDGRGKNKPYFGHDDRDDTVTSVKFMPPFSEKSEFTISLPSNFVDMDDRPLSNAAQFPLKSSMAAFPPLAKFATAPFGILELNADPVLPVTLRNVEQNLPANRTSPGTVSSFRVDDDAAIIRWIAKVDQYHEGSIDVAPVPKFGTKANPKYVATRELSLLDRVVGVKKLSLPVSKDVKDKDTKDNLRPFEVVGIPLPVPGFYVLELASQRLGNALLGKDAPMYVRTSALVTNLSVHIKLGRENGAVWVTTLDSAKPVAGADVRISDCTGKELWRGKTTSNGVALLPQSYPTECPEIGTQARPLQSGLFVSARKTDDKGRADMAFALSTWNSGIESYRFNLPTDFSIDQSVRAHSVLDRTLFRAGETVSMKHFIRAETMRGFDLLTDKQLPNRVRIVHQGSAQEFQFPLTWRARKSAQTVFAIPKQAKLGQYKIILDHGEVIQASTGNGAVGDSDDQDRADGDGNGSGTFYTGSFRVEEFRLPLFSGSITPPKGPLISPKEIPLTVQLTYLNGGGAAGAQVHVSSLLRDRYQNFSEYESFSFGTNSDWDRVSEDGASSGGDDQKIVADKLAITLDKNGTGKTIIKKLPPIVKPQDLLTEMTFADPNGEIQTISTVSPLSPSALVVGIKTSDWVSLKKKANLTALALDLHGKPQAGVALEILGVANQTLSHRKRMVGGFYAYENTHTRKELGKLCSGKTDGRGMLHCSVELRESGNVILRAQAQDAAGNSARADASVWVTEGGEVWFDGDNQDRMDILPEKKTYQPGELAKFQVRMPFRYATALFAVEREGILETHVVQLSGTDPTISLLIKKEYGPNVYVSVLAVRGRMREVPWYSFFSWGWKAPIDWWHEFREYQAPGPMVDLSKPAYKYGITEISVGDAAHELKVTVSADKPNYPIRSVAKVTLQVHLPNGKPAAGAEVAIAAVDEALLELEPNRSWDLLHAMLQRRSYGVETATAQMQVVGKRHYGRKAIPAGGGGGGGKAPTRELFDTLLLWNPMVVLDANGRAQINVPLNDALTSFKIVAVADSGVGLFGTGSVSIRSTQDVQLISGLPPLVREGDAFSAMLTVRNTTQRTMQVEAVANVKATVGGLVTDVLRDLPTKKVSIAAGESVQIDWPVTVPDDVSQMDWEVRVQEQGGQQVRDHIKFTQKVVPAVPITVQQANLFQLDRQFTIPLSQPADSLPNRGGVAISLAPKLSGNSAGLRRFFERYPYVCLEQKASRAMGLKDDGLWQRLMTELPTYLDGDGLAYYYPPRAAETNRGSDTLTAYLLATTQEAGFALPVSSRDKMLDGLARFVEGKVMRDFWSPTKDLDVRKLAALEALSRYGQARPEMLGSIQLTPNLWPTSAVLDWVNILRRVSSIPEREQKLEQADQILRSRLNYQGTRMGFSSERSDYWWWLMVSGDSNATRLILTMLDNSAWREDLPKLMVGAISRQQRGHWSTTTANLWGSLALDKFSRKFEADKVTGTTRVTLEQPGRAGETRSFGWVAPNGGSLSLPWPRTTGAGNVNLTHDGAGRPWVTLQSLAAVQLKTPFSSGFRINKTIVAVEQKQPSVYSRGDIIRVNLEIDAQADMTWVVVNDPIPAGATLLGSGLGRDSAMATRGEAPKSGAWLAYEERSFAFFRSYYEYVPKGKFTTSYTYRLNNPGQFHLPQTRVEALYTPEMFGETPNAAMTVK